MNGRRCCARAAAPPIGFSASLELPGDDPRRRESYLCGDMNTSLLRTEKGRTIMLQHDVVSPRPYGGISLVSGTRGVFRDYPPRIYLDGPEAKHEWPGPIGDPRSIRRGPVVTEGDNLTVDPVLSTRRRTSHQ
jgi:hypothetical protein